LYLWRGFFRLILTYPQKICPIVYFVFLSMPPIEVVSHQIYTLSIAITCLKAKLDWIKLCLGFLVEGRGSSRLTIKGRGIATGVL